MADHHELVVALRHAAHDLAARRSIRDLDRTLTDIVAAAVATVDGADAGGISMSEDGEVTSRNPTTPGVTKLDRLQGELGEGPCITALADPPDDGTVVVRDLAGEDADRWPRFTPYAVDAGYRSMLSCDLNNEGRTRAALNLYAAEPDAFDPDARLTAALFAMQAAMLLYGSEQAQHLQRAVDSRDLIGQAKGVLVERFGVDSEGAFQMLVRSSQDTNMKLVDVAQWLLDESIARGRRGPVEPVAE